MPAVVFDASAVLALVRDEAGADRVAPWIGDAAISAVNLQEVAKEMLVSGLSMETVTTILNELRLFVIGHDEAAALASAALVAHTRRHGRGLGDRSCMALGIALGLPVVTADREWRHLTIPGLRLDLIRE